MSIKTNNKLIDFVKLCFLSIFIVVSVSACVSSEDEALYNSSLTMLQDGHKDKAYENLKGLCSKFPDDERFCKDAELIRSELYRESIEFAKVKLSANPPVTVPELKAAEKALKRAALYATDKTEVSSYESKLIEYSKATDTIVEGALKSSEEAALKGEYITAHSRASRVRNLNPAVVGPVADAYGKKAVEVNLKKAESLLALDNLKEAKELLVKLRNIDPKNNKIREYIKTAERNDNSDYYMSKGDNSSESQELEKALSYYMKAVAFPDARQQAQAAIHNTRSKIISISFKKGVTYTQQEMYKKAYDYFYQAFETMKQLPMELRAMINVPKNELELYYDSMYFMGQKALDEGAYGQSYLYFDMLNNLAPTYLGLKMIRKTVEGKLLDRALKSIAVIPFRSPAGAPEIGFQITSNIMEAVQGNMKSDVRVIDREALEVLIEKYGLDADGNVNTAQKVDSRVKIENADYLLVGEVLDYKTETNIQRNKKKVRVKVGETKVRNIEWEDWKKEADAMASAGKEVPKEPAKYVMKPNYEIAEYDFAFHQKTSYMSVSYRLVNTANGDVVYSNSVRVKKDARDDSTSGIDLGNYNVEMKTAHLPSDIELSGDVRKEAVEKIAAQVVEQFESQNEVYMREADKFAATDNYKAAVEMYIDALVLKERKGEDASPLKYKASEYLDGLLTD
ncbi:hypothetical protein ACMC5R_05960 [Deferribacteres bacterium DY0037]